MSQQLLKENKRLQKELDNFREQYAHLETEYKKVEEEKRDLQKRIDLLLRRIFCRKSEKLPPGQMSFADLLNEAEKEIEEEKEQEEEEDQEPADTDPQKGKKKKKRNGRRHLPDNLPRETITIEADPEETICPTCGEEMQVIDKEVTEELDYIPAKLFVRRYERNKYACSKSHSGVVIPLLPERPIDRGLPGAGLLAQVAVGKYSDHIPLYRQENIFDRHGYCINRSTLCDWLGKTALLLKPIVEAIENYILLAKVVQSDDTYIAVRDKGVADKNRRCYLWVYCIPWAEVVYDFTLSRSRDGPLNFLTEYNGFLQTDGYGGYNAVYQRGGITHLGCWAHARRKFYDAQDEAPEKANAILVLVQALYRIEREAKDQGLDPAARVLLRQEKSTPILTEIHSQLDEFSRTTRPKSNLGKAITYAQGQWPALLRYVNVGEAEIDNNSCESAMRSVVLGRKNWMHLGSAEGGSLRATVFYSLIESCKRLKVEPFAYLRDVIDRVSVHPASDIWQLTPRGWKESFGK